MKFYHNTGRAKNGRYRDDSGCFGYTSWARLRAVGKQQNHWLSGERKLYKANFTQYSWLIKIKNLTTIFCFNTLAEALHR